MGKGEIARYEQFLLFPQCFQKACFQRVSKGVIVWESVKGLKTINDLEEGASFNIAKQGAVSPLSAISPSLYVSNLKTSAAFEIL